MRYLPILFLAACSIPNPDDIHLAECMHGCNKDTHACLNASRVKFTAHPDVQAYIDDSQACALALMDCVEACVDDAERALK